MQVFRPIFRTDLRSLILLLTIGCVLVTFGNSYQAIYNVQRQLLINTTLEANQRYAAKVAESAEMLLASAQNSVAFSAKMLSGNGHFLTDPQAEVYRLVEQSRAFNSAVIVNHNAEVIATFPQGLLKDGYVLPENTRQSFYERKPLITSPFHSVTGNTLISISHPIWSKQGEYLGYISGAIYLNKNGSVSRLMRDHFFSDDTYLYVVDKFGELLFHADPKRIGENVSQMQLVQQSIAEIEGSRETVNSLGIEMVSGHAPVPSANWGVVVQRPKSTVMQSLNEQMQSVFWASVPIALLTFITIWVLAYLISKPLRQLARSASNVNDANTQKKIVAVRSWYYEASQLKMAVLNAIGLLNDKIHQLDVDSHTDPLTQLYNRRGMQRILDDIEAKHLRCSVLALDIDHFKSVNDRYGHDVGDLVIQKLAFTMSDFIQEAGTACRVGGEEFLIFLPNTSCERAFNIAESLCEHVSIAAMPKVKHITVSVGVGCTQDKAATTTLNMAIKQADAALYEAKNAGRNCVRGIQCPHPNEL